MKTEITYDGGPAFPRPLSQSLEGDPLLKAPIRAQDGMSLRDYFAAKAMAAMMLRKYKEDFMADDRDYIAFAAYQMADMMLIQRDPEA